MTETDTAPAEMDVVTKAMGATGSGLVAVGTRMTIKVTAFSGAWMKPATQADARKLNAHRKKAQGEQSS